MLTLTTAAAAAIAGTALAADDPQTYDRRLAQAAADIVAARMGGLRGGFGVADEPGLSVPAEMRPHAASRAPASIVPPPGIWRNGLAVAIERRTSVSPDL